MTNIVYLLAIFLMTMLVACTGGSTNSGDGSTEYENGISIIGGAGGSTASSNDTGSGNTGGSTSGDSGTSDSDPAGTDFGPPTLLEGNWIRSCILINPSDPDEGYRIWTLTFQGNRFSSHIRNFTTPGCTSASAIYSQVIFQGYFEFGDTIVSSEGLPVRTIDVYTQTPITNVEYDIFHQDGTNLYFGDTDGQFDGTTVENRPDSLDFYWELIKEE